MREQIQSLAVIHALYSVANCDAPKMLTFTRELQTIHTALKQADEL